MSKKKLIGAGVVGTLLAVTGVGIACAPQETPPPPVSYEMVVAIEDTSLEVGQRESVLLDVTNMENEQIRCDVDVSGVVYFDENSKQLIGIGPGTANVTFTLKTDSTVSKTIQVTVTQTAQYTVKIGDGEPFSVVHGSTISQPKTPDEYKDNEWVYAFDCWVKQGSDIPWDFDTPVTSNLVLEERWNKTDREYKVLIDGVSANYHYGDVISAPTTPLDYSNETTNFIFDGWIIEGTETKWNFAVDRVTKDGISIVPSFRQEIRYYTVTYTVDGKEYAKLSYEYNETIVHPQSPTKESTDEFDFEFVGWIGEDNGMKAVEDMVFTAEFVSKQNYSTVSGKVVDENGKALVAQMYLDGEYLGRSASDGTFSYRVKISQQERGIIAVRDGYYEVGKKFTPSITDMNIGNIITKKSGLEGKGATLTYDRFGSLDNVDDNFRLEMNGSGNGAVGYTFNKGLSEYVSFSITFNEGCGFSGQSWGNSVINVNGVITDNNGQKIGMGISSAGTLNTSGTSLALTPAQSSKESVGAVINRLANGITNVTYNLVYTKLDGEISLFAKSSLMDDYVLIGEYESSAIDGELGLSFAVTSSNTNTTLAFTCTSLVYGDKDDATAIVERVKGTDYKIEIYEEDVDGKYALVQESQARGYKFVTISPENKEHFVINYDKSVLSGSVSNDLVLKVYYQRETYDVTYYVDGEVYCVQTVRYGSTPQLPFVTGKPGYSISWDKEVKFVESDMEVNAILTPSEEFSLMIYAHSKKVSVLGETYESFELGEQVRNGLEVRVFDSLGEEIETDGFSAKVRADEYTVELDYNGYTYLEKVRVENSDAQVVFDLTNTVLGGEVGGFKSFSNSNKTYVFADEVHLSHYDFTYNANVQGTRYYIESDIFFDAIDGKSNAGVVGIMPLVRNELLEGSGAAKVIIGVTQEGKLAYTHKGGWGHSAIEIADVKDKITYNGNKYSYKLGIYRNGGDLALFINGEYIDTVSFGMFEECGFGLGSIVNNDANGKVKFSNYTYSFNEELLSDLENYVRKDEVQLEVTVESDYVLDKNGKKLYYQGEEILSKTAQGITLEIYDLQNKLVKKVVGANRKFTLSIKKGTYKFTARYEGVKGVTSKSGTLLVANDTKTMAFEISLTDMGGSYTIPNGTTVSSHVADFTVNEANSVTVHSSTYAFVDGVVTDTAYIEGTFDKTTTGWYGFMMNASEGAPSSGYKMIVFAILLDEVGLNHSLYIKHSTADEWWKGTGAGSIENFINDASSSYKMGVLRVQDYYYVYINDKLFWSGQIIAKDKNGNALAKDNKSGFGVFGGSNCGRGDRVISNIKYTTDIFVASAILNADVYSVECDDNVTFVSQGRSVGDGEYIFGFESNDKQVKIDIPQGKEIADVCVKINGARQDLKYVSDGVFSFVATEKGNVVIDVEYVEVQSATLDLSYKSASIIKDGTEYALYDVSDVVASDITVSIRKIYSNTVMTFALDSAHKQISLDSGTYEISYKYGNNVCAEIVQIARGENVFAGEISKAHLGGSISFINKTTGNQYTLTSFDRVSASATSGGNWSLIDNQRNSVHMTTFTYVIQDKVVSDQVYMEGKFDLTSQVYDGQINQAMAGLLLAHGLDELSGNAGSGRNNSHKLIAGIYKEALVLNWHKDFNAEGTVILANLEELGLLDGDRTRVKLGVLRNKNTYYFYVNDVYVAKYIWDVQTDASGIGLASIKGNIKVYEFNYSTSKQVVDALTVKQEVKDIDIYLIAGQSNASGYSNFTQDELLKLNDDYVYGFNNIWYAGNSRSGSNTAAVQRIKEIGLMRAGLGAYVSRMGVEPGLAEALSEYYNPTTGKEAGFIKYAAGGTRLLNYFTGENAPEGNWVPPSYQATLTSGVTDKTGGLYRNFLAQVRTSLEDYKKLGYNPIIKGMYWMQGESDRGEPSEYLKAFKYFASDVRKDLSEISGQDCSSMPIVIGEISRSFASCDTNSMNTNATFIAMQNTIPQHVANTYIVASSVYDQNKYINGVATQVGSDQYHWNYKDHLKIGNLVGECILKNILITED